MLNDSNSDLPGSLEEFGLSKYEARAYLTMIGKGSLAASQSPRIQMQMDRQAKMLQTASNLMRKMAEAGSTTVRNLK